mmetsp:Transcript_11501/g.33889  ORF Transcript_11501/g.33889 Transcript_11501/m.33889 type:complete len:190 (-) Transcript_11501:264-833(-)
METHYEVLGISACASLDEIKTAHRRLARALHPDKAGTAILGTPPLSTSRFCEDDGSEDGSRSASFLKVQEAWECLRDSSRKREYDESLARRRERVDLKAQKAVEVRLSQLEWEICDVESDDFEASQTSGIGVPLSTQKVFFSNCRCGDCFELLEEELINCGKEQDHVWECQTCSLAVRFIVDISLSAIG